MKHHLKQLIPSQTCLACEVCCRYPDRQSPMAPVFSREELQKAVELGLPKQSFPTPEHGRGARIRVTAGESCYRCPAFVPGTHECTIYPERPFDCQLYPYLLMFNPNKSKIHLVMDPLCPFIQAHHNPLSPSVGEGKGEGENLMEEYGAYLHEYLSRTEVIQWICQNQNLVSEYQDSMIRVCDLEKLTKSLVPEPIQQGLTPLTLRDFDRFQKAFARKPPALSCEHFLSHYLWSDSLRYYWTEINGYLCLFAEAGNHLFMPVPPMGVGAYRDTPLPEIIEGCFEIMNFWNQNRTVSRISGMREEDLTILPPPPFMGGGRGEGEEEHYKISLVEYDYIDRRIDLVNLRGNAYKSKRANYNQFLQNHPAAIYRPFTKEDIPACLRLYQTWLAQYKERRPAKHEIEMAQENFKVHQKALLEYEKLGLMGRVVELDGKIAGYTFGVPLSPEIFYIIFEITDLRNKGISQYLFREFCRELEPYEYVHAGGDSGVVSLARVKESYHPVKKHPIYQISEKPQRPF